jgi:hypothetical protein
MQWFAIRTRRVAAANGGGRVSKRRTHSTIDKLPADLRETLTRMVVDGVWPEDFPRQQAVGFGGGEKDLTGRPTYDDVVKYCTFQGYAVSRSALGRWAKGLLAFERMRTAGAIARDVMKDVANANVGETQKAAAEIITAQIIDIASSEDLTAKEAKSIANAIRDCTAVAMKANDYVLQQIKERAAAAVKTVEKTLKKKQIDPETLKLIREQIYGITG